MIEVIRRNGYYIQCEYTDENDVPIDLSGYSVKLILKKWNDKSNNDDEALVNKSFDIVDGTDGTFNIELTSQETTINTGNYKFEVQLSKTGEYITVHQEKLVIKESYIYE